MRAKHSELRRVFGACGLLGLSAIAGVNEVSAQTTRRASTTLSAAEKVPRTIMLRGERLAEAKRLYAMNEPSLKPTFDVLMANARAALDAPSLSVMQKGRTPSSGNKHDYMSMAPYFWPNPKTKDSLPYVNRDGEMNPESRKDHDGLRLQQTIARVRALALAGYLSDDPKYSAAAAKHLRVFFLDTATRMNPNLNYAQAVLGVSEGRSYGIIDSRDMPALVDAIRLLQLTSAWTQRDTDGMTKWCSAYLKWLLESKNGVEEGKTVNNHVVFYDEQVASLALFVGDTARARMSLDTRAKQHIASQIDSEGKQKLEIDRTRPVHYTLFNLEAFTMLAELSRHIGVDLWNYEAPNGASIRKALLFIAPYANPAVKFPKEDIAEQGPGEFVLPFRRAAAQLGDSAFARAVEYLPVDFRIKDPEAVNFPLEPLAKSALERSAKQLRNTAMSLDVAKGYPRSTIADGSLKQSPASEWTSGFFAGELWYMYQDTGAAEWKGLAERWMTGLEANKMKTTTHDLGFMMFDSFGHAFLLTGDTKYRDIVMQSSKSLVTRFNPKVGLIKSWDTHNDTMPRKGWQHNTIVDNLMNLEMLFWASAHGGDAEWAKIAERHAITSAKAHVRADGSTGHVALFDTASGKFVKLVTWQGYADGSAWARGQAWAIHGLTASYGHTKKPELLTAAQRSADWFISHLPADGIPFWDFRDPKIPNVVRDASAAAIAASGMYELALYGDAKARDKYRNAADMLVARLATNYMAPPSASGLILAHSTGGLPFKSEVDVGIVYADYFFIEALLRQKGLYLPKL